MKKPTASARNAEITQPATFPYMFAPSPNNEARSPAGACHGRPEFASRICVRRSRSPFFHDRLAHDLFDRGDAVVDREQAALAEGAHAALLGLQAEDLGAGVLDDLVAHLVVEQHDLVDALPAPVAAVVAVIATLAVIEDLAGHVLRL